MESRWSLFLFLLILQCSTVVVKAQKASRFQLVCEEDDPYFGTIKLTNYTGEAEEKAFLVFPRPPQKGDPAMLGKFESTDCCIYFRPRFPFIQGRTYWIKPMMPMAELGLTTLTIPQKIKLEAPRLTKIYPSGDYWPANQLKFYLHFDQPMEVGKAMEYIEIVDEQGEKVKAPFLDMGQELWDVNQEQLTIWFDPGRIKTGLIPNRQYGPPLKEGQSYQLRISRKFRSITGLEMEKDSIKHFETQLNDRMQPDPAAWELTVPMANTQTPLMVQFPESLDYALLKTSIWVEDDQGNKVTGRVAIGENEMSYYYLPLVAWEAGEYRLQIATDLEDLAGNNLERIFDTALTKEATIIKSPQTNIEFVIKPESSSQRIKN